jgi:hypothetical protein
LKKQSIVIVVDDYGIAWDYMGVNGKILPIRYKNRGGKMTSAPFLVAGHGLRQNHKNLLKKPQNVRGVNTLLTFWGHHMG